MVNSNNLNNTTTVFNLSDLKIETGLGGGGGGGLDPYKQYVTVDSCFDMCDMYPEHLMSQIQNFRIIILLLICILIFAYLDLIIYEVKRLYNIVKNKFDE